MKKNIVIVRVVLIVLFAFFIAAGVRAGLPAVTGGISSHICLACMGFR